MSAIRIPLGATPTTIAESAAAVLRAHGFVIARAVKVDDVLFLGAPMTVYKPLTEAEAGHVLGELGKNAAQCLVALEVSPDAVDAVIEAAREWRTAMRHHWITESCTGYSLKRALEALDAVERAA